MPKLPPKRELTKIEEAQLIVATKPLFEYYAVTSKQLGQFADAALKATNVYSQLAESLIGPARAMIEAQKRMADYVYHIAKILTTFNQINFVIPIPRQDYDFPKPPALPIYIQPDSPYTPIKEISSGKKKQQLPLTAIKIEGKGFMVEGEYIKGITLSSKTGKLLQLMLREDLQGIIPYKLIGEAVGMEPDDYRAWGFVMRDLKQILIGKKKLKLNMERYKGIEQYRINSLTKYLRRPGKSKKINNTIKNNN